MKLRIKKGDTIQVLSGKDRGKTGQVEQVLPAAGAVVVSGINIIKKHVRPRKSAPHGGIVTQPAPLTIAKVMAICPRCSKPTRVSITVDKEGKRHRTCKKCHEIWPK